MLIYVLAYGYMCLGLFRQRGGDCNPFVFECKKGYSVRCAQASPIIFFISGTDMTFDEGLLGIGGGVDFVFAAVWFLLLLFAIVPLSLLPIDLRSLVNVACRRGVARGGDLHPTERKHH